MTLGYSCLIFHRLALTGYFTKSTMRKFQMCLREKKRKSLLCTRIEKNRDYKFITESSIEVSIGFCACAEKRCLKAVPDWLVQKKFFWWGKGTLDISRRRRRTRRRRGEGRGRFLAD